MFQVTHESTVKMSGTNRLICQEMLRRSWTVAMPYWYVSIFHITRNDGKVVRIFSSSPSTLSYAAAYLSNDKYATTALLSANGIFQLPTFLLLESMTAADANEFVTENKLSIVKPLDGSHGNGITANIASIGQLEQAIVRARSVSASGKVLLQKQITGDNLKDVRVLIINGRFIGAIHRVAARVFGDAQHTVKELIARENQKSHRGEPYKAKLAVIDSDAAERYLGPTFHSVPSHNEEVTVLGVANYGAGGELVDVTDEIPEWMKQEAVAAAGYLDLKVAGVDYMIRGQIKEAQSSTGDAVIIEVNKSPSLAIHDEPTIGKSRQAVAAYVDYLATL